MSHQTMLNNLPQRKLFLILTAVAVTGAALLLLLSTSTTSDRLLFCTPPTTRHPPTASTTTAIQLEAILHYATSRVTPQQNLAEITLSFDVLRAIAPCNFLVFGLGHDSLMWAAFNPDGNTLFLEEDPKWVHTVLQSAPNLNAITVDYKTKLKQADQLLDSFRSGSEPECSPAKSYLKGNTRCKLAISGLPDEVYDKEWDIIMIDAPRGYFDEAPGRMGAIYSAAVMARNRKKPGVTHVFLHDVDRRVEKTYAQEFLCRKNLKKGTGRLWHFEIPPAGNGTAGDGGGRFC